jgi:hypothetical protein
MAKHADAEFHDSHQTGFSGSGSAGGIVKIVWQRLQRARFPCMSAVTLYRSPQLAQVN